MRITAKGRVTIPIKVRRRLGLLPGTDIDFVVEGDTVRIVRRTDRDRKGRGAAIVRRLRGTGTVRMMTDEILSLTRKS